MKTPKPTPNDRDDRAFMLTPESWPETSMWAKRIYLKKGSNGPFAQLAYLNGRWGFCLETAPFEPDLATVRWGGSELVDEIVKDRWLVD